MPASNERLSFERELTSEEYRQVSFGLIPSQMEDNIWLDAGGLPLPSGCFCHRPDTDDWLLAAVFSERICE